LTVTFFMSSDVRDKLALVHGDVVGLNFIRDSSSYVFRRHYRTGLRSHIMELLRREDVEKEQRGLVVDGIRWFPKARPAKMLRIFRIKFRNREEAQRETERVRIIERYLAPHHLAKSEEFLVDYASDRVHHIVLCGLQAYVQGEILDPWGPLGTELLGELFLRMNEGRGEEPESLVGRLMRRVRGEAESFVGRVKKMVLEAHYIPDLAGVGNLLLTPEGEIKLVDINNISAVTLDASVTVDDRGYPVCDKSVEALSLLERKLLKRRINPKEEIYKRFLDPARMKELKAIEKRFQEAMKAARSSQGPT
jgi:hypothetical protein